MPSSILNVMQKGLLAFIASTCVVVAQEQNATFDDLTRAAEQWANENLDDDALRMLQSVDQKKVKEFLSRLEKEFRGQYVVDLAQLKETAKSILPVLEQFVETEPYAVWLKNQMDNLDAAERIRKLVPAPKQLPDQPRKPSQNPTPQAVTEIWIKKFSDRPWPPKAKSYVTSLKPVFAARRVPPELVWIAEVESSFDSRARSPAGATGLFQLMPATAHRYGLRTWPLDQRLKPEPSAAAAALYLRSLHGRYNDWRLAVAAYNAGEGTVDKLLARHKTKNYDAIAQHLPAETQLYVPRVEATLLRREGVRLSQLQIPTVSIN